MTTTVVSCGVLLLTPDGELLLGHATGARHWDIPKGVMEPDETPRAAAVRELREETGLRVADEALVDLGRFPYRPRKDLALFASLSGRVDAATLVCTALFRDRHGRMRPEIDAFAWVPAELVAARCAPALATVLTRSVRLPAVLARLLGDAAEHHST
jgi:8-oxo-dGTP pyrophosphatase MutT (NUDIX family)